MLLPTFNDFHFEQTKRRVGVKNNVLFDYLFSAVVFEFVIICLRGGTILRSEQQNLEATKVLTSGIEKVTFEMLLDEAIFE
jgi:hypothetical protein